MGVFKNRNNCGEYIATNMSVRRNEAVLAVGAAALIGVVGYYLGRSLRRKNTSQSSLEKEGAEIRANFEAQQQGHVFQFWNVLTDEEKQHLLNECAAFPLTLVSELHKVYLDSLNTATASDNATLETKGNLDFRIREFLIYRYAQMILCPRLSQ